MVGKAVPHFSLFWKCPLSGELFCYPFIHLFAILIKALHGDKEVQNRIVLNGTELNGIL